MTQYKTIFGYGISNKDLHRITKKNMAAFIRNHYKLDEYQETLSDKNLVEHFSEYNDSNTGAESIYSVVSDIIWRENNIMMQCETNHEKAVVMLAACMPWQMLCSEKILTEEDFDNILQPYLDELGIPDAEIGEIYFEIES